MGAGGCGGRKQALARMKKRSGQPGRHLCASPRGWGSRWRGLATALPEQQDLLG